VYRKLPSCAIEKGPVFTSQRDFVNQLLQCCNAALQQLVLSFCNAGIIHFQLELSFISEKPEGFKDPTYASMTRF
jgi:hypothetical protein